MSIDWKLGTALLCALSIAGCETDLKQSEYSQDYGVNVPQRHTPFPDACLEAAGEGISSRLPPGCANALNLMRMVERPGELQKGTNPGPALAAPVGQAVRQYLTPDEAKDEERRQQLEREASTGISAP